VRFVLLVTIAMLCSCTNTNTRYQNWEYVRIEYKVPNELCTYKVQEACSSSGAKCFNYYKKRATLFDANTVVITNTSKNVVGSSKAVLLQGSGGANTSVRTDVTTLADYYYCPKI
jgi:hypothetical protein